MGYELPESGLEGLDIEALSALESEGLDAFRDLDISDDTDADTIAEGERIVAAVREVREAKAALEAAEADRQERVAAIRDFGADAPEAEPVEAATEQPVETAAEEVEDLTVTDPTPVKADAVIEASDQDSPIAKAAAAAVDVVVPEEKKIATLTAAADVPGIATGTRLDDFSQVAGAVVNRMKSFPTGTPAQAMFNRYGTAVVTKQGFGDLSQENYRDDEDLLRAAADQSRLPGGSLTAAASAGGGWCSPSETLYDWCADEDAADLVSLPEINVSRGGIRFTKGPDFSDIFAAVGFKQTETQAIAATAKSCYVVQCPPFTDVRCDAMGVCITAPILTNAGYPELVADIVRKSLVAHELKVNAELLTKVTAALGTSLKPANQGATVSTLESLAWVAESIRTKYGFSDSKTIEVVMPKWAKISIREDLARRQGNLAASITDAQIYAWFSERNLAPQFVRGLDDLDVSSALQIKPKDKFTALMYPAGSFIKGTQAVITLDSVYDSTNLVKNLYTALFAEECVLLADRCYGGAAVEIPVCDSGRSGAADLYGCFGVAEPTNARPTS